MKNILVATDFSSNAYFAAICAAEITCRIGGRLILFHALSPLAKTKDSGEEVAEKFKPEEAAQKALDLLAYELHNKYAISVSRLLKPGFAETEIPELAQSLKAELVVLGAQGENLQSSRLFGNLASEILNKSNFPVVCIPAESTWDLEKQLPTIINREPRLLNGPGSAVLAELSSSFGPGKVLPSA